MRTLVNVRLYVHGLSCLLKKCEAYEYSFTSCFMLMSPGGGGDKTGIEDV
jgi:hypothetical protein